MDASPSQQIKKEVEEFYHQVGWQRTNEELFEDARQYEETFARFPRNTFICATYDWVDIFRPEVIIFWMLRLVPCNIPNIWTFKEFSFPDLLGFINASLTGSKE